MKSGKAGSGKAGSGKAGSGSVLAAGGVAGAIVLAASAHAPVMAHPHVWVATETTILFENGAAAGLRYSWLFDEMYTTSAVEGLDTNKDGKLDASELAELTKVNIEGLKEFDYFTAGTMAGQPLQFGDAKDYSMKLVAVADAPGPQMVAGPVSGPGTASSAAAQSPSTAPKPGLWARFTGWVAGLVGRSPAQTLAQQAPAQQAPVPQQAAQPTATDQAKAGQPAEKPKVLALHMTLPFKAPLPADQLVAGSKGLQFMLNDPQMFIWFEPTADKGVRLSAGAPASCRHAFVAPEQDEEQKKLAEAFGRAGGVAMGGQGKAVTVICR